MNPRIKQALLIALLLGGAAAIAFALYFVFFRTISERPSTEDIIVEPIEPSLLPIAIEGQPTILTPPPTDDFGLTTGIPEVPGTPIAEGFVTETVNLSQEEATSITLSANGNTINYYSDTDDRFYRIDQNGQIQELSDEAFVNVQDVQWSPDSSQGILTYPDGTKQYYNFDTGEKATLPSNWEEFSFSPNSQQIAFKERSDNPDFEWISIANPDGTGKQIIQHMGINADRVSVTWSPNNEIVGHYWEGAGEDRSILYFVGKNDENFKGTYVEGANIQSKWTSNGEQLLYSAISSQDGYNPRLWIVNARGNMIGTNRIDLGLNTFADKCTIANDTTVYCAVPEFLERGAGLEPSVADSVPDSIIKIDLTTGQQTKIAETDIGASIDQLVVTSDESNIFFTDAESQNLRRLRLR